MIWPTTDPDELSHLSIVNMHIQNASDVIDRTIKSRGNSAVSYTFPGLPLHNFCSSDTIIFKCSCFDIHACDHTI